MWQFEGMLRSVWQFKAMRNHHRRLSIDLSRDLKLLALILPAKS
jgi:hypothetical protein